MVGEKIGDGEVVMGKSKNKQKKETKKPKQKKPFGDDKKTGVKKGRKSKRKERDIH